MITNFHFKTIKYRKSFLWRDLSDSFKDSFHYKYSRVRNKRPRTLITVILEKILIKKCLFQPPTLFRMEIFSTHPFYCGCFSQKNKKKSYIITAIQTFSFVYSLIYLMSILLYALEKSIHQFPIKKTTDFHY